MLELSLRTAGTPSVINRHHPTKRKKGLSTATARAIKITYLYYKFFLISLVKWFG
jgi:hypothetical protein